MFVSGKLPISFSSRSSEFMESGMRDVPLAERMAPSYTLVLFFKMKNIQNKANKQNTPEGKINK